MSFKQILLDIFNFISPVEAYPYDKPTEELRAVDIHTDSELSKLADQASTAEIDKNLVLQTVDLVHKIAISSATANIAHRHPNAVRLLNENPTNKEYLAKIQNYFKEIENTPESLDTVTFKLLDQIQHFYPALRESFNNYSTSMGLGQQMKRYQGSPISNSRLLHKQLVDNPQGIGRGK